jgi:heme A synthase
MGQMKLSRFAKYAWAVLAYNVLVILWGAYVRASGSGAGCGSHWPSCNGQVIPLAPQIETIVEFTHRLMSGLSLIVVFGLILWAWRAYPKSDRVRLGAALSMFFILTEALVGAGLVLFNWVAKDQSLGRAVSMAVHLVNTFLLLAVLTLTAWWGSGGPAIRLRRQGPVLWGLAAGLLAVLVLGVSGALNALGDTLFPSASLAEGIVQDFLPTAHFLIRLRVLHPTIAVTTSAYLLALVSVLNLRSSGGTVSIFARMLVAVVIVQVAAGLLNVALLAPIWMQIVHLLLADLAWIVLVLMAAAVLSAELAPHRSTAAGKLPARPDPSSRLLK